MIRRATLEITAEDLLWAIWYSDAYGARGLTTEINTPPDSWEIADIRQSEALVIIEIVKKG